MPAVALKKLNSSVSYCLWQIDETEEFFFSHLRLTASDEQLIRSQKLPVRRLEKLACRAALSELVGTHSLSIVYDEQGCPKMPEAFLSFSHCKHFSAAAFSRRQPVGIDIEPIGERILKLWHKFLSDNELKMLNPAHAEQMHFCWGAKEAMYKMAAGRVKDYVHDLQISGTFPHNFGRVISSDTPVTCKITHDIYSNLMSVICF